MKVKSCVLFALSAAGAFALRAVELTANQMPVSLFGVAMAPGVESDA